MIARFVVAASVAGVASAGAVVSRDLQGMEYGSYETGSLCGGSGMSEAEAFFALCDYRTQSFASVAWPPCCVFDVSRENQCRYWQTDGSYCDTATESCDLNDQHYFDITMAFETLPLDQECCKTCVCFGDPECVSFFNVEDLWVPCDARKSGRDCRMYKSICEDLDDPNGNKCEWNPQAGANSNRWNIGFKGSPCTPKTGQVNGQAVPDVTMLMYEQDSFRLDLSLGERGIIEKTSFTIEGVTYTLDAEVCFQKRNAGNPEKAWTSSSGSIPDGLISRRGTSNSEVSWRLFDATNEISAQLLCIRAANSRSTGIPRINVQALSTPESRIEGSSGFCQSGQIEDKTGAFDASGDLHYQCTASDATALQACKMLVSAGLVENQLAECAKTFCEMADVGNTQNCINSLGNGRNSDKWTNWFCRAVNRRNPQVDVRTCQRQVRSEGWPVAREFYEFLRVPTQINARCANSWSEYAMSEKDDCVEGVYVEVMKDGSWEEKAFIPSDFAPCIDVHGNPTMRVPYSAETEDLFKYSVRFRQCDPSTESECGGLVSTCSKTAGASWTLTYSNFARSLIDMFENDKLRCSPDPSTGSITSCLPEKEGGSTLSEEFACDYCEQEICADNRRRALLGN